MTWWMWLGWGICGIVGYGLTYGEFDLVLPTLAHEGRYGTFSLALVVGLAGPFGLIVALGFSRRPYRFRLWHRCFDHELVEAWTVLTRA